MQSRCLLQTTLLPGLCFPVVSTLKVLEVGRPLLLSMSLLPDRTHAQQCSVSWTSLRGMILYVSC